MGAAALALPWLTLLPLTGAAGVLALAAALIAALHGAGLAVARLGGDDDAPPALVIQWGIAAVIAASGAATLLGLGTLAAHAALVFGLAAVHTGALATRFTRYVRRVDDVLAEPRAWLGPAIVLGALGALAVLGAAGEPLARPFDDDGHVPAQLHRLLTTGALASGSTYTRPSISGTFLIPSSIAS